MTSTDPRFQVQTPDGPFMRVVWDTYLATEAARFYSGDGGPLDTREAAERRVQLLAETRASELNLQSADPLRFVELLAAHITHAVNEAEEDRGNVLEDVSKILEHYAGKLRGVRVEPLRQETLYVQATWVDHR